MSRPLRPALALALVLAAGCGSGRNWKYNEQVEGAVKMDGAPVPNVLVRFVPDDPTVQGPTSSGYTDEKGNFTLTCENGKKGAVLAKHNVLVIAGRGPEEAGGGRRISIPPVYANPVQTPLQLEVTADKHTYDLALSRSAQKR